MFRVAPLTGSAWLQPGTSIALNAAEELGIHPSTLFRKIRDLGIEVPPGDGRRRGE